MQKNKLQEVGYHNYIAGEILVNLLNFEFLHIFYYFSHIFGKISLSQFYNSIFIEYFFHF